jgi:hypothetical protein
MRVDQRRRYLDLLSAVALAVAVVAAAPIRADEPKLTAGEVLRVEAVAARYAPGSKDSEDWRVKRLAPIDKKRFLALLNHSRIRHDVWSEPEAVRKAQKTRGVVSGTGTSVTSSYTLAILRRDGKLLATSDEPAEAEIRPPLYAGAHALPLVMDGTDTCPYALLEPTGGNLLCYDLDLHFMGSHRLPLDEITGAKVTFDGVEYTLWLFGARYGERPATKSWGDTDRAAPERPRALGARFKIGDDTPEPLPFAVDELQDRLRRVARDPEGERVELDPAGIRLVPFNDLDQDDTFWALAEAISADRRDQRSIFSGSRLYFRVRLSPQGLGKVEQLPVWVVQEDRGAPEMDLERGIFSFPRYLEPEDLQAFSLGRNDLAVRLKLAYKAPQPDGSFGDDPVFESTDLLGVFRGTGQPATWIPLQQEQTILRWRDQFARNNADLDVLPGWFLDRVGRDEFAFRAHCRRRGAARKVAPAPCVAFLELEY